MKCKSDTTCSTARTDNENFFILTLLTIGFFQRTDKSLTIRIGANKRAILEYMDSIDCVHLFGRRIQLIKKRDNCTFMRNCYIPTLTA